MRYFTREVWAGGNSRLLREQHAAAEQWDRNRRRYIAQLKRLLPRLGRREAEFFLSYSLYDGRLVRMSLGDDIDLRGEEKGETRLVLLVQDYEGRSNHELSYRGIHVVRVDSDRSLFPVGGTVFGDWGYDELLAERKGLLRHNVLFSCGTELSIVFERVRYRRHRVDARCDDEG